MPELEGLDSSSLCTAWIVNLRGLPRADLIRRWAALHGSSPPRTLTMDLLVRGIAYEVQVRRQGGLTAPEKKALAALAEGKTATGTGGTTPGTRLYRNWQGTTHEVLVLESGYGWRGKIYDSLSEVARAITGTRWSGPRFFGVKA